MTGTSTFYLCIKNRGYAASLQVRTVYRAINDTEAEAPLEVIEQITYLLFIRRLDDLRMLEENKSAPKDLLGRRRQVGLPAPGVGKR